jgi:putative DNA primase/helicase
LHPKKLNGSYRTDGARGWARNWETGETATWRATLEPRRRAPPPPLPSFAARRAEEAARAEQAAKMAQEKIARATAQTHPYLERKGFPKALGLVLDGLLLVPARINDKIASLQEIAADGTKKNLPGGRMSGASFSIGSGRLEVLCEGYATGLSIKAAMASVHLPARVTCCFSAANIATVAENRRHAVVLADHDKPVAQFNGLGTGEFYARRTGLPWVMPPKAGTDANDLHLEAGMPALQPRCWARPTIGRGGAVIATTSRMPASGGEHCADADNLRAALGPRQRQSSDLHRGGSAILQWGRVHRAGALPHAPASRK